MQPRQCLNECCRQPDIQMASRFPNSCALTHLSENRIADTRNRARKYPKKVREPDLDYQLMRARVVTELAETPEEAVARFRGELEGTPRSREAAIYGLVLALTASGRADEASLELDSIWSESPDRLEYIIADAEIDMARNKPDQAAKKLAQTVGSFPRESSPDHELRHCTDEEPAASRRRGSAAGAK